MCGPEADLLHCHRNSITNGSSANNHNRVNPITVPALQSNPPRHFTSNTKWPPTPNRVVLSPYQHHRADPSLYQHNRAHKAVPSLSEHHRTAPSPYQQHYRVVIYHHTRVTEQPHITITCHRAAPLLYQHHRAPSIPKPATKLPPPPS